MSFSIIKQTELQTWVKVLQEENPDITAHEVFKQISLMDELLILQKSKSLLNKKKNLKKILMARIDLECGNKVILNLNNK